MASSGYSKYDILRLADNTDLKAMLATEGEADERLIYSEKVLKINRKDKRQDRAFIMTDKAIYNCKMRSYKKSQRRIGISDIGMVTLSTASPEFVIHVPSSYDYHLVSENSEQLASKIADAYRDLTGGDLYLSHTDTKHLAEFVLTKKLARYEAIDSKHMTVKTMKDMATHSSEDETF